MPALGNENRAARLLFAVLAALAALFSLAAPAAAKEAVVMHIDGAIGPATASHIADGLQEARERNAALVVLEMDTPGGLDTSMRDIIQNILGMPMPVVTYVHPSGARAASAGTYILYASHFAAMTPGTNLGAATPVQIAGPMSGGEEKEKQAAPADAHERKAVNDAVAYIRSLAELRGRNADWAEQAVREASSLSASAALKEGVIDIVASDLPSLLDQLNGKTVTIDGQTRSLNTAGLAIHEIEPGWGTKLLAAITNPNIALILMMIGVYGLIFEFLNPGSLVPGTVGAISLVIGLYALAALPVDMAGLALIALGIALMVGEAFVPSFGILGIGGTVAFVIGAAILFDTDVPAFQVSWSVIAALGVFSAGLLVIVARVGLRALRHRVTTGSEELIGATATVIDWHEGKGHVFVHSERWNARGPHNLTSDQTVVVEKMTGLDLTVSPQRETET
ncbi:serine protease [Novosphingobium indicum]|uniref:Serine protease n=1 Tax=Novosphingobium indicum TaxID=462949 RepID=A0ABQ2J4K4_9SPHN|nr:nodulation protein NfeD [Novosphingobium indicum]GGN40077.1 serine protease [Novosphingobium indicum]